MSTPDATTRTRPRARRPWTNSAMSGMRRRGSRKDAALAYQEDRFAHRTRPWCGCMRDSRTTGCGGELQPPYIPHYGPIQPRLWTFTSSSDDHDRQLVCFFANNFERVPAAALRDMCPMSSHRSHRTTRRRMEMSALSCSGRKCRSRRHLKSLTFCEVTPSYGRSFLDVYN